MTSNLVAKMMGIFEEHMLKKVMQSFVLVDREERKARLHAVMALSVELAKIREVSIFSTGLAESLLEDIIEGDWEAAQRMGAHFSFEGESPEIIMQYAPLWVPFRKIVEVECLGAKARQHSNGAEPS